MRIPSPTRRVRGARGRVEVGGDAVAVVERPAPFDDDPSPARNGGLEVEAALRLTLDEYRASFWGTALARARYDGILRNAVLAAGASGDPRWRELKKKWREQDEKNAEAHGMHINIENYD